jgi:hypothetical protein
MQLADVGLLTPRGLRRPPSPANTPGLRYAELMVRAPLGGGFLPRPSFGQAGLLTAWDDDDALDRFLADDPLAQRFAGGWSVRLLALHISGHWPPLADLAPDAPDDDGHDGTPVAVLTIGHLKLSQARRFLRANVTASNAAVAHPGLLAGTGLARPPHIVSTFSLWRSGREMRDYAHNASAPAHLDAATAQHARPFHSASAFIRFHPYAARGQWDGREPLAELAAQTRTSDTTTGAGPEAGASIGSATAPAIASSIASPSRDSTAKR